MALGSGLETHPTKVFSSLSARSGDQILREEAKVGYDLVALSRIDGVCLHLSCFANSASPTSRLQDLLRGRLMLLLARDGY